MAKGINAKPPVLTYGQIGDAGIRKKRISREIILDILTVLLKERKIKKSLMRYKTRLDWRTFSRYLDFLLKKDFIAKCNEPEVRGYEITQKGKELLKSLKEIEKLLQ